MGVGTQVCTATAEVVRCLHQAAQGAGLIAQMELVTAVRHEEHAVDTASAIELPHLALRLVHRP